jgi:hypothetical protein
VDLERPIALHGGADHRLRYDSLGAIPRATKEMPQPPEVRRDRSIVRHDGIQPAIVDPRPRRDDGAVAILPSVGEDDHQRALHELGAIQPDAVRLRTVGPDDPQPDREIGQTPSAARRQSAKLVGNPRIEANAREVEEQPSVDFAGIDRTRLAADGAPERLLGVEGDSQFGRQTVAGPGRHDAERHTPPRQDGPDLVDRTVSAPRDHASSAVGDECAREFGRMPDSLANRNRRICASFAQHPRRQLRARASSIAMRARAGDRIDDHADFHRAVDAIVAAVCIAEAR